MEADDGGDDGASDEVTIGPAMEAKTMTLPAPSFLGTGWDKAATETMEAGDG